MCGIAGYVGSDIGHVKQLGAHILDSIAYRGRDAQGTWSDEGFATLFHTRLSIIDLDSGTQPMTSSDGRYVIVFNGEIYNYRELRARYEALGAIFRTESDTEVILEGFRLKGPTVVSELNGMFSFTIWDQKEKALFLARDRLGKKPLFWTRIGSLFAFSSTIATFAALPGWDATLSTAGLALYGLLGGFPNSITAFQHAHAVPAAHWAWYRLGDSAPTLERYWRFSYAKKTKANFSQCAEEYEELLSDALQLRLRSDVPIAMSFSGGVDSGTLAALAKVHCGVELHCYTIDYDSPEEPSEEAAVAREAARRLAIPHEFINYNYRSELLEGLEKNYPLFDQPCQQLALVYSSRLYEIMKSRCTVVISGNGADEIFTGYGGDESLLAFDQTRNWVRRIPDVAWNALPAGWRSPREQPRLGRLSISDWWLVNMRASLRSFSEDATALAEADEILVQMANDLSEHGIDTMLDCKMHNGLTVAASDANYRLPDITGYAAQVEVRSPFLDYRMVEFAARLRHCYKIGRHEGKLFPKYLPRRVYERHVGSDIAWGHKRGMGANLRWDREIASAYSSWFARAFQDIADHGLNPSSFIAAYQDYCRSVKAKEPIQPSAGVMMNGAMIGHWLRLSTMMQSAKQKPISTARQRFAQ